ncbi:protein LSM14 homolog B isoform X6 [Amyelois transitella]|uniref:protein LSM14 homolog B isoform X6 n=1 Tax=Amyelois transitella TaxID=680683 RepID=UPI00298F5162|nr:protein LSM14 homolog B isoform X6 [Amyelois transitella]
MSSGMPELGSKISLVSKADIRYEGRLFTVDPQECTIALASVRSFGTENRETQYPVAPQSQVYDYILFRGSDIKDIRVVTNVPSLPNDPAIMQMSVPPTLGGANAGAPGPFAGSMMDLLGGSQQSSSRSGTPSAVGGHRKSPTADQGTQQAGVATGSGQQRDGRRGSAGAPAKPRNRTNSRTRQRYPSGGNAPAHHQNQNQHQQQNQHHQQQNQHYQQNQQMLHQHPGQGYGRGGWRGRGRGGRGRGFVPRNKNTLKFDNDYDFEQANTEFEELRSQLAKTKISEGEAKPEVTTQPSEVDKKDDSGNETGAGEAELDDDGFAGYDRKKSFFDSISCEAVERSKGRSQRTDWRTERKLNAETFGVALARRGAWRGRGAWRHHNPQHQPSYFPSWRPMRGGRGRPGNGQPGQHANHGQHQHQHQPRPNTQPQQSAAAAAQ